MKSSSTQTVPHQKHLAIRMIGDTSRYRELTREPEPERNLVSSVIIYGNFFSLRPTSKGSKRPSFLAQSTIRVTGATKMMKKKLDMLIEPLLTVPPSEVIVFMWSLLPGILAS